MADLGEKLINLNDLRAVYEDLKNGFTYTQTTISASGWGGNSYSFEAAYPNTQYDIEVTLNGDSVTTAQMEAWSEAQVVGSATTNVIKALGTKPTVNIPVIIGVRKKGSVI